ncbi:hypothetical protein AGABI2DRAFT_122649 [Agaricus bisporus var. bisporus H97]|uniref:hypothetical protein n=1 Tax=Agaricus bisporus var. bisporus (strain H97 / ATCC MYA-4626 / FGSC 10389) TaxID=936046 RepID=UPI00029F6C18|nr:hypothetical protein AGABI2DRAFT_122649 [Agaricus bisporus var. bisporus H97]EKV42422.1 hypothetical protein AGABI2DRAFT_122649 [Agaricus bisporus var. bisporus H97]
MLLFSCHLSPHGPSSLAALRFSAPVRLSGITIFPHGAPLFPSAPHVTSITSPAQFGLELFFNALPHRPQNALLPTSLAYPGGTMHYAVDMGRDYATRLMIVKGAFTHLSIAIYGELVAELPPLLTYQPAIALPTPLPRTLSADLDLSQSSDPTALASAFLSLMPKAPSLASAIRRMFCLKFANDDWDNPLFPHLYANLDDDSDDYDLESIVSSLDKPLPDDPSQDSLDRFVERLTEFIGPPSVDQAYQIAVALNSSASQSPLFSNALLNALDLSTIFNTATILDVPTLTYLTDAASNALIARHLLHNSSLPNLITDTLATYRARADKPLAAALLRLRTRLQSWQSFEDALTNPDADFVHAAQLVHEIGKQDGTLGNWLTSMILHDDVSSKLNENLISLTPLVPPVLFAKDTGNVTHDQFIAFVRACVGVASLLGVLAWADSVGNDACRERTLAVLHLWQSVEGYREIVNHLFLLRQFTRRLSWITTDNEYPRHSALLAEKVLCSITSYNPSSILNEEMVETILALKQPLAWISEKERLTLRKLALVVDDGLEAAVEELKFESGRPFSLRRLKTLRVSIAMLVRELDRDMDTDGDCRDGAEWLILQAFWREGEYAFLGRLVDLFVDLTSDLEQYFVDRQDQASLQDPNPTLVEQLFWTSLDFLLLIERLIPPFTITARSLRHLVSSIVSILVCVDEATTVFCSQSEMSEGVIKRMKCVCLRILDMLCKKDMTVEHGRVGPEVVLKALLMCGIVNEERKGMDTVARMGKVLALVDQVLPRDDANAEYWKSRVLPSCLIDIRAYMRGLTVEDQSFLLQRLVKLDQGVMGIGEWLVLEEAKEVRDVLASLAEERSADVDLEAVEAAEKEIQRARKMLREYRVYTGLQFFWLAASLPENTDIPWFLTAISSTPEISSLFTEIFNFILEAHYTSPPFASLTRLLACPKNLCLYEKEMKLVVFLALMRLAQVDVGSELSGDWGLEILERWFGDDDKELVNEDALRLEIGRLCGVCADHPTLIHRRVANMVIGLLEWLVDTKGSEEVRMVRGGGLSLDSFGRLCDALVGMVSDDENGMRRLEKIKVKLSVDEELDFLPIETELPERLGLSLDEISGLVRRRTTVAMTTTTTTSSTTSSFHYHSRGTSGSWAHHQHNPLYSSSFNPNHQVSSDTTKPSDTDEKRPSTPQHRHHHHQQQQQQQKSSTTNSKTPDIFGTIISPPMALLRSPAATGLTKTYVNNDFRQLRQDFESVGTTTTGGGQQQQQQQQQQPQVSPLVVPVPIPLTDGSVFGGMFNMGQ